MPAKDSRRSDAQANKDLILDVARNALAADPHTSLNSIAKEAGIGAGTLYRHFPSRESLVLGVYRKEVESLVALAPSLLSKHTPVQAFRMWCDQLAKFGRIKYGVADIVHAAASQQDAEAIYEPMLGAVSQLMKACKSANAMDPEAKPEDFLVLVGLLWRIPPTTSGKAQVERLLALAFRGLGLRVSPNKRASSPKSRDVMSESAVHHRPTIEV